MLDKLSDALEKLSTYPEIASAIAFCDDFLYSLTPWHLAVFGAVFALFIFFLIASAALSSRPILSLLLQIFAFGILIVGPVGGYFWTERFRKPFAIENLTIVPLYYPKDMAAVFGEAVNLGDYALEECRLKIIGYEPPSGALDRLYKIALAPARGETNITSIAVGESRRFEVELRGAGYEQNLTLSIALRCR
jgi:hypothetical protein